MRVKSSKKIKFKQIVPSELYSESMIKSNKGSGNCLNLCEFSANLLSTIMKAILIYYMKLKFSSLSILLRIHFLQITLISFVCWTISLYFIENDSKMTCINYVNACLIDFKVIFFKMLIITRHNFIYYWKS